MNHVINQLRFEISYPSEEMAFSMRHQLSQTIQLHVEQLIDQVCTKYGDQKNPIRIDQLEIDLGDFHSYTFDATFPNKFIHKFEEELVKKIQSNSPDVQLNHPVLSDLEALLFFLQSGSLPWWKGSGMDVNDVGIHLCGTEPELFKAALKREQSNKSFWKRISLQCSYSLKRKIIEMFLPLQECEKLITGWTDTIIVKLNGFKNGTVWEPLNDTAEYRTNSRVSLAVIVDGVLSFAPAIFSTLNINLVAQYVFKKNIDDIFISKLDDEKREIVKSALEDIVQESSSDLITNEYEQDIEPDQVSKFRSDHGGIVLLAQFLKPFFSKLKLWKDNSWADDKAQFRAVHLLRFLATGKAEGYEHELMLEKILCGVPIGQPLPYQSDFTTEELEEAKALLESIIEHWKALKNTSIQGLQDSFLKRECIVSEKDGSWQIYMERKTMDVLLDKIPWGYSMIVLPWNRYFIYVEW